MYRAFPTDIDRTDRSAGHASPLPRQAWHGYGVSNAHHGEVRRCRRACERTPSEVAAVAPPAGTKIFVIVLQIHSHEGKKEVFRHRCCLVTSTLLTPLSSLSHRRVPLPVNMLLRDIREESHLLVPTWPVQIMEQLTSLFLKLTELLYDL
jgi:hypothetical protein